jgi:soluble lytic murein transglycosylase
MEALAQGKALWMVAADQPANCNVLFDGMISANVLTEDDIWARFRLALAENKINVAKSTVKHIKNFDAASLRLLDRAYQNPRQILDKKLIFLKTRYGREVNLYALERLSRSEPSLALVLWQKQQTQYSDEDRGYLWGRFALHAANRHDPIALEWFGHAQEIAPNLILDKEQLAWKARAAMREKNWNVLQSAITAMSPTQQEEGVWRYWKARALKEQQQLPAANAILAPLSTEQNYYGLLAKEELGDVMSAPPSYYKASEEEVRAMMSLAGIQRALELLRLDMRGESKLEWVWAVNNFDDRQLIAAAEVAFRADWYDMAINTADKTKFMHDFSLRYPTPYLDMMQSYARENNLDEAWVYGLIRQESRFTSRAKSSVGASGLMQVMPATAKWIAKRLGLGDYRPAMIHELDTNIQFGTHYLRYTMDEMDGQAVMATAAYNAGPSRPKRWAAKQALEGAIYAESIPLNETRDYVKKVMANACFYAQRLGTKAQTLKQRLGVVAGTGEGGVLVAEENQ